MSLETRPIPVKRALRWNKATHRRLPDVAGLVWAIAALRDSQSGADAGCTEAV